MKKSDFIQLIEEIVDKRLLEIFTNGISVQNNTNNFSISNKPLTSKPVIGVSTDISKKNVIDSVNRVSEVKKKKNKSVIQKPQVRHNSSLNNLLSDDDEIENNITERSWSKNGALNSVLNDTYKKMVNGEIRSVDNGLYENSGIENVENENININEMQFNNTIEKKLYKDYSSFMDKVEKSPTSNLKI